MGAAVLPFLGYLVLQLAVMVLGLNIVRDREIGVSGVLKSWIFGQMICFAVLQVMAVPMILMRWKFDVLFWSYTGVVLVLFGFGCWMLYKRKTRIKIRLPELKPLEMLLLMIVILLILWQAGTYFFGMHLDEDDARFLAQANDALEYGNLLTRHFDTGEYLGRVDPIRDVTSPWTMMYAIASRVLFTKPAIFAHTIYPTIEIFAVYGIYWLIGRELFWKKESQLSVVLLGIIVNLFFTVTTYTQSMFTLIRIWQGKASVAAVIVPMLIYLFVKLNNGERTVREHQKTDKEKKGHRELKRQRDQTNINTWIMVIATGSAACLMSGAGIPLSFVAITILGIYNIVIYQQWERLPLWMASLITPLGSGLLYVFMKG